MELRHLAEMADEYNSIRLERLEAQRKVDMLKEHEDDVKAALIKILREQQVGGVAGTKYRVTLKEAAIPVVKDWEKVYEYIKKYDAFDILQQRLSPVAIRERREDGDIPGIEDMAQFTLGVNKL